jgi:hypothetical protein
MIHQRRVLREPDEKRILEEAVERYRAAQAEGAALGLVSVPRDVRDPPGRPYHPNTPAELDAHRRARQEGQRSPAAVAARAQQRAGAAPCAALAGERVAELADYLDGRTAGIDAAECRRLAAWLRGG